MENGLIFKGGPKNRYRWVRQNTSLDEYNLYNEVGSIDYSRCSAGHTVAPNVNEGGSDGDPLIYGRLLELAGEIIHRTHQNDRDGANSISRLQSDA
ncbi:hypothetical protein JTB14_026587 [Gonioctena quinquepunctata]|nr:hypothetical protein JTB14_026587 [Gonioctena quinquepunctata]